MSQRFAAQSNAFLAQLLVGMGVIETGVFAAHQCHPLLHYVVRGPVRWRSTAAAVQHAACSFSINAVTYPPHLPLRDPQSSSTLR